jgi:hypothetical protein
MMFNYLGRYVEISAVMPYCRNKQKFKTNLLAKANKFPQIGI